MSEGQNAKSSEPTAPAARHARERARSARWAWVAFASFVIDVPMGGVSALWLAFWCFGFKGNQNRTLWEGVIQNAKNFPRAPGMGLLIFGPAIVTFSLLGLGIVATVLALLGRRRTRGASS